PGASPSQFFHSFPPTEENSFSSRHSEGESQYSSVVAPLLSFSSSSQQAKSLMDQGLQHLQQARYEQAIAAFRQALELDPTLVTARYDLGVAYFSLNQFDEARQAF